LARRTCVTRRSADGWASIGDGAGLTRVAERLALGALKQPDLALDAAGLGGGSLVRPAVALAALLSCGARRVLAHAALAARARSCAAACVCDRACRAVDALLQRRAVGVLARRTCVTHLRADGWASIGDGAGLARLAFGLPSSTCILPGCTLDTCRSIG
jgi:hypothetical protein